MNVTLKLERNKYCETKLFSKMDKYYETEGVHTRVRVLTPTFQLSMFKMYSVRPFTIRHGNETHTYGYPPEPNPVWRVFPVLTGFGYGFVAFYDEPDAWIAGA